MWVAVTAMLLLCACAARPDTCVQMLNDANARLNQELNEFTSLKNECWQTAAAAGCDIEYMKTHQVTADAMSNPVKFPPACLNAIAGGACELMSESHDRTEKLIDQGPMNIMAANSCEQTRIMQREALSNAVSQINPPGSSFNPIHVQVDPAY